MTETESFTSTLKKAGMRITPQRIAICKLLAESHSHPTAADIYGEIKGQYPSLSLATVYNTLETLVAQGVVNALGQAGDGRVHFDPHTEPHINLACVICHQIVDLPSQFVAQMDDEISHLSGYDLLGARVLYYGICPECQLKEKTHKNIKTNSIHEPEKEK